MKDVLKFNFSCAGSSVQYWPELKVNKGKTFVVEAAFGTKKDDQGGRRSLWELTGDFAPVKEQIVELRPAAPDLHHGKPAPLGIHVIVVLGEIPFHAPEVPFARPATGLAKRSIGIAISFCTMLDAVAKSFLL
jgi:hypothetical protein